MKLSNKDLQAERTHNIIEPKHDTNRHQNKNWNKPIVLIKNKGQNKVLLMHGKYQARSKAVKVLKNLSK